MSFFRISPLLILSRFRSGLGLPKVNRYHKLLFITLMAMALLSTVVQQKTNNTEQLTTYNSHVFQKFFQKRWKHILDRTRLKNNHTQNIGRQLALLQQNFQVHNQLYQQSIQKSSQQNAALTTQKQRLYQEIDQIQTQVALLITSIENLQRRINVLYQEQSKMISANEAIQTQIARVVQEQRRITGMIGSLQKRVTHTLQNIRITQLTQNDLQKEMEKERHYLHSLTTFFAQYVHGIDQQRIALLRHQLTLWLTIPVRIKKAFQVLLNRWKTHGRSVQLADFQKRMLHRVEINPDNLAQKVYGNQEMRLARRESVYTRNELRKRFGTDFISKFSSNYERGSSLYGDFHPLAHAKETKTPNAKEGWEFIFRHNQAHSQTKRRLYVTRLLLYYDESTKRVHARIYKAFEGLEQSLDWSLIHKRHHYAKFSGDSDLVKEATKWAHKVDQAGSRQVRIALAEIDDQGNIHQTSPRKWKDLLDRYHGSSNVGFIHDHDHDGACTAFKDGLHVIPDRIFYRRDDDHERHQTANVDPKIVYHGVPSNRARTNKGTTNPRHNPDVAAKWGKDTN